LSAQSKVDKLWLNKEKFLKRRYLMKEKDTKSFHYAMGLHMHQPPGNLKLLIETNEWEARQIIHCYDRAARYALAHPEACFHVDFSGVLIEQFLDPFIVDQYRRYVDIPRMLDNYRKAGNIEIIGMGYYHPIFPLIPCEDWPEQLDKGQAIFQEVFGRRPRGFWPSEMAFCMEMIPDLVKAGYSFVVVDHVHVQPADGSPVDPFQLYTAAHEGHAITIVPRHRDMSNAQESGLNPEWFLKESQSKLQEQSRHARPLLTTWSDGENGGWFRQMDANAGFFGYFWTPLIEQAQQGDVPLTTVRLSDFVKKHPPQQQARVNTGAWNVASTDGYDFAQWNGSESQKKAIEELCHVSGRYWEQAGKAPESPQARERLARARQAILDAETSCYLFWGEAWLPKLYAKLDEAKACLE
jgi:alpha-amylase/alpha-mannosidase (GH57 family)